MIDKRIEMCTAKQLLDMGLAQALKAGSTVIKGEYKITPEGLKFDQQTIAFRDKLDDIKYAKFKDENELMKFAKEFNTNYEII